MQMLVAHSIVACCLAESPKVSPITQFNEASQLVMPKPLELALG